MKAETIVWLLTVHCLRDNRLCLKGSVQLTTSNQPEASRHVFSTSTGGINTTKQSNVPNDTDVESTSKKNEVHIGFIFPGKSQPFSERFFALFNH